MQKKLISFEDVLLERINEFSENYKKSFTEAVRVLIQLGLKTYYNEDESLDGLDIKVKAIEDKMKEMSWWSADEGSSKLHNLEVAVAEIEKKINVLSAASKLFKAHISNRSIHLQD